MESTQRGAVLVADLQRLKRESVAVYETLVLPGWGGPQHGLPDTLYGYIMGLLARIDLASAHWMGNEKDQSIRMVDFMTKYMNRDRRVNSVLVQVWRHKLMHTASPRVLVDRQRGLTYRWLLHWGDEHLPREQHLRFQPNGEIVNLSLFGLIDDIDRALSNYLAELLVDSVVQQHFDRVERKLSSYHYRDL